ncbi:MAG: peptidoglycan D,D-transpeptidase FtsI family protein [Eubacterium sp.]
MYKRIVAYGLCIVILFVTLVGRMTYISLGGTYTAGSGYNSYSLVVNRITPTLYYRDMKRMTNDTVSYIAIIRPTEKCIGELDKIFAKSEINEIMDELKLGKPIAKQIKNNPKTNYINIVKVPSTGTKKSQLIAKESSGFESYIQDEQGIMRVNFDIDALGRLLSGDEGSFSYTNYDEKYGYVLSIDRNIQNYVNSAMQNVSTGAAVVMDVKTGGVLACVSKPDNSYLNRCFCQYAVGSVFKIVVAVSAIENEITPRYDCKGTIKVGDTTFSCAHKKNHGTQDLRSALGNSCNCYFVNLATSLGYEKLLDTSKKLGYGSTTNLFANWTIKNGVLPSESDLLSPGQLALLGFGQGKLTASPLQVCSTLATIGNDGIFTQPNVIISRINHNGQRIDVNYKSKRAIKSETAKTIQEYLRYVVTDGTGTGAEDSKHKSSGKTATAQTGQFKYGRELMNTWFAGLYPFDNPKYAIAIIKEDGDSGAQDCCPIFRTIVENLN